MGFGVGSENLVSKKVSVLISENLVSEKKYRFWSRRKSVGFDFGEFGFGKIFLVSIKILFSSFSGERTSLSST